MHACSPLDPTQHPRVYIPDMYRFNTGSMKLPPFAVNSHGVSALAGQWTCVDAQEGPFVTIRCLGICFGVGGVGTVEQQKLIIDTDCGIDDAVAILMAHYHAGAEIAGITTVQGNVAREHVTRNVCDLLSYLGADAVPVYEGASRPLVQEPVSASEIHGPKGLGSVALPSSAKLAEPLPAPAGIAALLELHPGATIVALGPLTNIALTINLYPQVIEHIGSLVVMGGALGDGNVTKFAEFNAFADPEAAHVVLSAGLPVTLVPWDACISMRMSPDELRSVVGEEPGKGALVIELQQWIFSYMEQRFGVAFTALADPLAMACALEAGIIERSHNGGLRMELSDTAMRGATVPWPGDGIKIVDAVDRQRFSAQLGEVFGA